MESKKNIGLKIIIVVTFVAMVVVNALANILPINGINTGAVSDSYPNLFAPTGLTFSIWGVIYALLAVHVLFQLGLFRDRNKIIDGLSLQKTAKLFSLSSLINTAWIFSWHYRIIPLSMVLMACLLVCLILVVSSLKSQSLTTREKLLHRLPFSVYFGWITVATIANATTLLVDLGWNGFGLPESTWTVIMLAAGTLIGTVTALRFKDIAYGLVLIWAYVGILIKHTSANGFSSQYTDVIIAVVICIAIFATMVIYNALSRKRKQEVQK